MEAPEVPTEHLHEELEHHAEHSGAAWVTGVALSFAIIAALAAVSSLLSGHNVDEGMVQQMQASDQWNYYQAKGVKANVLQTKIDLTKVLGKAVDPKDTQKLAQYKKDQEEIKDLAETMQKNSRSHMENHHLAEAVTIFQISIALGAIAALTKKRGFWFVSLCSAICGTLLFGAGYTQWRSLGESDRRAQEAAEEQANPKPEAGAKHEGAAKPEAAAKPETGEKPVEAPKEGAPKPEGEAKEH